jgi:riboflavin kinase/FMN adenylyltransferase
VLRWTGLDQVPPGFGPSVVSVGVFDGVHRGHQAVVSAAVARARELDARSVVVTFQPNPLAVLRPELAPPVLSTLEHRVALLERLDVDAVLVLPFTAVLAAQSAEDFVTEVLLDTLHAKAVVVGENFRFGHRAAGNVALLERMGAEHGFEVDGFALTGEGEATWSSTFVRSRLAEGDVEGAAHVLGRPHRLEGPVVHGDQRGRTIGYPTANLGLPPEAAVPADGVYAGWLLRADGSRLPAAISIGTNPTFDGTQRRVEAYVLDRDDLELYDEHVALDFVARLRETLRFDGVGPLVEQMGRDVDRSREILGVARPA